MHGAVGKSILQEVECELTWILEGLEGGQVRKEGGRALSCGGKVCSKYSMPSTCVWSKERMRSDW